MQASDILRTSATIIDERASLRDIEQERSMSRTVALFNTLLGLKRPDEGMTELEGWLFMICLKMARAMAGRPVLDDFIDAAAYCALAAESLSDHNNSCDTRMSQAIERLLKPQEKR